MRRLVCWLVGHDPVIVEYDQATGAVGWDCRRECGWTLHQGRDRKLPALLSAQDGHRGLVSILVAVVMLGLAIGMTWYALAAGVGVVQP
jgi:hypothetical protein